MEHVLLPLLVPCGWEPHAFRFKYAEPQAFLGKPQNETRRDCKLYGLPDFNHENPVVWQGLMQWLWLGQKTAGGR